MEATLQELEAKALGLEEKERAELARILLLSLDPTEPEDPEIERQWAEEAERRYQEILQGVVEPIDSDEVFREARARLR
jgi:hypothetical protein